ncbi:MAG: hypothetical protein H6767_02080 [Candidatus Peribacteria bacterium]|nr:MAG: hypothetical protein H6767_02080 [Candidatus Peribacteria bacterium]
MYLVSSNNCQNCLFSYDLENCQDCIGCYNLVGKQYYINNKSHTKEEYHAALNQIKQSYFKIGWGFIDSILPLAIHKNLMMVNCEDCIGDNLKNCKSCHYCFHFEESENCKYAENGGMGCYNAYDGRGIGENLQFGYEILDTGINAVTNAFLISCYTCNTTFYSINCHNSSNLFGCLGLKNKEYCILNKQYTKEEYETLVPQLIQTMQSLGEWGEFFPSNASLFGYNETAAQEYYPLTKEETVLPVILSN